jgi:aspartyl-tRNA(Asn)/glutamyl-tRNA(Gln) amidotransferase subunit A
MLPGLAAVAAQLRSGAVTSERLVMDALAVMGSTTAFNYGVPGPAAAAALAAARASDDRRRAGSSGLGDLDGVPFTVKDNFCVRGDPCAAGSAILRGFVSPFTASCVQSLLDSGAVLVGRTNMDEFGMGSSTTSR